MLWKSFAHYSERIDAVAKGIYTLGEAADAVSEPAYTLWGGADGLGEPIGGPQGRRYRVGERDDTL